MRSSVKKCIRKWLTVSDKYTMCPVFLLEGYENFSEFSELACCKILDTTPKAQWGGCYCMCPCDVMKRDEVIKKAKELLK
jgi:hypothetical protein